MNGNSWHSMLRRHWHMWRTMEKMVMNSITLRWTQWMNRLMHGCRKTNHSIYRGNVVRIRRDPLTVLDMSWWIWHSSWLRILRMWQMRLIFWFVRWGCITVWMRWRCVNWSINRGPCAICMNMWIRERYQTGKIRNGSTIWKSGKHSKTILKQVITCIITAKELTLIFRRYRAKIFCFRHFWKCRLSAAER